MPALRQLRRVHGLQLSVVSDAGMIRDLPGRARAARVLIALSAASMVAQMLYEGAADLGLSGADYGGDAWSVLDAVSSLMVFVEGLALAFWSSALFERVQAAWPGSSARLPSPHAMAWIVFLFPLTIFFPWLYLRRAARIIGATRAARLAGWYYGGALALSVFAGLMAIFEPSDTLVAAPSWSLVYALVWVATIAVTVLLLPLIGLATERAMRSDVGAVFA